MGVDFTFFVEERQEIADIDNPLDLRRGFCWKFFSDPQSETFNNCEKSALKAGYSEYVAQRVSSSDWFRGRLRSMNIFAKSVEVLQEMLDMPIKTEKVVGFGDDAETVVKTDPALVKIKQDTAKFVAARRGKDEGWSERHELTGANGQPLGLSQLFDAAAKPAETPPVALGSSFAEFHEIPPDEVKPTG